MCWGIRLTILLLFTCAGANAQPLTSPFSVVSAPEKFSLDAGQSKEVHVAVHVPPNHYLYRDKTALDFETLEGLRVKSVLFPEPFRRLDPFFNKEVEVYDHDVEITATIEAPTGIANGQREVLAILSYQGCSEKLCFKLEEKPLQWVVAVGPVVESQEPASKPQRPGLKKLLFEHDFGTILSHGILLTFLLTFLGGLLTAFTPCVLPLLPVILLIIGIHPGEHRRNFLLAGALAVGLAVTYAMLGLAGALLGVPMSFLFQQRAFLVVLVLFYLAMALSMFGLFTISLPVSFQSRLQRLGGKGVKGAFLAGISTGLLATPCAGPVIGALVAYVGTKSDLLFGFLLLLTYGLGFGAVFMVLGTFYGGLTQRIRKPVVARIIKIALGCFLLLPAGYYGWVLVGSGRWQGDETAALAQARALHRPVMVEFTSKSCPPCIIFEQTTLKDPRVVKAFADEIVPLRVDSTVNSPAVEKLIERYQVVGWPTIMFVSPEGEIFRDMTRVGEVVSPEQLLELIAEAKRRVHK